MTHDFDYLASTLTRRDPGIWFSSNRSVGVSYPAFGNAACLAVEERSFWFRHRNRCIVSLVRRFPPDGCILDIGGGNGFVSKELTAAGMVCALLEPGIDGALAAHARGIDPVICARLEDAVLPAESISAAGMFDVLEHVEDEGAALKEINRLLAPNGLLFLTVPAYQFLFSVDDVAAGHHRRYTVSTRGRLAELSRRRGGVDDPNVARLGAVAAAASDKGDILAAICTACVRWTHDVPEGLAIEVHAVDPPALDNGERAEDRLTAIRAKIGELTIERLKVSQSPEPKAEMKKALRASVAALVKVGAPRPGSSAAWSSRCSPMPGMISASPRTSSARRWRGSIPSGSSPSWRR
jgi:SAM-dependent methyltransferase